MSVRVDRMKLVSSGTDDELLQAEWIGISLDNAFKRAGEFGRFQKRFFVLVVLYQIVPVFHNLCITFVGLEPNWHCSESTNTSSSMNEYQRCALYNAKPPCTPKYTDRFHSIAQEFGLICNQTHRINVTQSWFFCGFLFGAYILGYLADVIGRRKLVIGYLVLLSIVQLLSALSPSYLLFALGRFAVGFFGAGAITMYILACEIIGAPQRSLLAVITAGMFGLGYGLLSLTAFIIPHWRGVIAISAALTIVFVLFCKYIPESPRWLYVTGRDNEARLALMAIASANGHSFPYQFTLHPSKQTLQSPGLLDFFKHKKMRQRMFIQMLEWFTVCMVYYGLSLGVGGLSKNLYLGFTLSGLVEIPSNIVALFALEKLGRKWSNIGFLMAGGAAGLACSYVQLTAVAGASGSKTLGLSMVGKFAITAAFTTAFTYTPELIPTDMRNFGMGVANVCARLGGIAAPLVILLDTGSPGFSMLIMGSLSIFTGVLCLYLPETLNTSLPNTLDELIS